MGRDLGSTGVWDRIWDRIWDLLDPLGFWDLFRDLLEFGLDPLGFGIWFGVCWDLGSLGSVGFIGISRDLGWDLFWDRLGFNVSLRIYFGICWTPWDLSGVGSASLLGSVLGSVFGIC